MYEVNIECKSSRSYARKLGIDIPKQKPGVKRIDLESYIDKSGDCWTWMGRRNPWGYGSYTENYKTMFAHREMYKRYVGEIPDGFVVLHKCDNPACCNPAHLSVGTHRDNQLDKFAKNRQAKGDKCGTSILTSAQVLAMREMYSSGKVTYKQLASMYEVCVDTVRKAVQRIYWRHI
jgi:hypothetical protein